MKTDADLLRDYVETGSDTAFTTLVERHVDFVYSAALRQLGGDTHLAKDAVQLVFVDLTRKARALADRANIVGWLYTSACFAAAKLVRSEQRRQARETKAHDMHELTAAHDARSDWNQLRPILDQAMLQLNPPEREAVLLRFFTGQSFAEIGSVQKLSEDTARKRVERALQKLQALLVRQGVTSTAAGLALVLSQHAVIAAPAGLAASVSGAALVAGGTVAGGSSTGVSLLQLMNTAKTSGTLVTALLLGASLILNAILLVESASAAAAAVRAPAPEGSNRPSAASVSSPRLVADADLAVLRDQLRAAGATEPRVREVLYGILRRRFREQLSANRMERLQRGWWRDEQRTLGTTRAAQPLRDDPKLLREMLDSRLLELLGPAPLDTALVEARYGFLPPALRETFARLDREAQVDWMPSGQADADAKTEAEMAEQGKRVRQRREELVASLTPEQRAEYEMRLGDFGMRVANQFGPVIASEEEFRTIFSIADGFAKATTALAATPPANNLAARSELEERTLQQLIAAVGYERTLDYVWGGSPDYMVYARVAQENNLPPTTASRVSQLAAETGGKAATIHADASLSVEQRRAALLALQQNVRRELDGLLPAPAQQRLNPRLTWVSALGEGRYQRFVPTLPGRTGFAIGVPISIDSPAPASPPPVLPRRPAGS